MGTRVSTFLWKSGQIIPGTSLRFIRDPGEIKHKNHVILVECLKHGNRFKVFLGHLKSGFTAGCLKNKPCVWHGFEKNKIIPDTTLRFIQDTGKQNSARQQLILVECLEHGNRFEVLLRNVKNGQANSCRNNKTCMMTGFKKNQIIPGTVLRFIKDTGKMEGMHRFILVRCECGSEKEIILNNLKRGLVLSCGCKAKWESEGGEWGSQPECFVMSYLSDLGVPYVHDGKYNHGTQHRWDLKPFRKTADGRRFLIEVTEAGRTGPKGAGSRYWQTLRKKVARACRNGDVVIVLKFYGKDREEVCDRVLFPALVHHGIIE
jgi:hypothetical protein